MANAYKPSNHVSPSSILFIPLTAALASVVLGYLYVLGVRHIPFIYINIVTLFAWGAASMAIAKLVIRGTKARNPFVAGFLGVLGGLVGYYVHWAFWLRSLDLGFSVGEYLKDPGFMIQLIREINEEGTWGIGKSWRVVNGTPLLIVWIVEFVLYLWTLIHGVNGPAGEPFDETSGKWFEKRKPKGGAFELPPSSEELETALRNFSNGDFSYFLTAPMNLEPRSESPCFLLTLYTSPDSYEAYATLEMKTPGGGKNDKMKETTVVKLEALSKAQADSILARRDPA
ncbi:MAG: hypothetical protein LBR53_04005 [Deltaproteobacteria bacterium]|jgi:hypothetical protein|nr:hypothetical protein [Deltaproteobacteria bacterium]